MFVKTSLESQVSGVLDSAVLTTSQPTKAYPWRITGYLGSGCYDYRSPPFRVGVTVLLHIETEASKHHAALFASGPGKDSHNS